MNFNSYIYKALFSLFLLFGIILNASAQLKRKEAGDIDRDAPDPKETVHQLTHDIKAHERQMKSDRVYSDTEKIKMERKKLREFKRFGMREDYNKGKMALKHYKRHLKEDRRRNRRMDVFD